MQASDAAMRCRLDMAYKDWHAVKAGLKAAEEFCRTPRTYKDVACGI